MDAAHEALTASAPIRRPRFFVFHWPDTFDCISTAWCLAGIGTGSASIGTPAGGIGLIGLDILLSFMFELEVAPKIDNRLSKEKKPSGCRLIDTANIQDRKPNCPRDHEEKRQETKTFCGPLESAIILFVAAIGHVQIDIPTN